MFQAIKAEQRVEENNEPRALNAMGSLSSTDNIALSSKFKLIELCFLIDGGKLFVLDHRGPFVLVMS